MKDWPQLRQPLVQARLFMCYVATHPEKLDESRADQWRKVAPSCCHVFTCNSVMAAP